ncbi:MAG: hypothetical protein IKV44_04945 [Clostridia bacterium]|nr:hypothetical protein [Clostridia bacterium]
MSKPQKEQSKKKQFVLFGLCSFIALLLCMLTLVITVKQVEKDNSVVADEVAQQNATELKNDFSTLSGYALRLTEYTRNNKLVKVNTYTDVSVDDSTIKISASGEETDNSIFIYAKNRLLSAVDGWYGEDYTGTFGTVYEEMPIVDLAGVSSATATYSTGLADESGNPVYDDNGEIVDEDYYYVILKADGKSEAETGFLDTFRTAKAPAVGDLLTGELASACTITGGEATPADFTATLKVNRFTDEIAHLSIERLYNVRANVAFTGSLSSFGEKTVEFTYKVTEHFDYYYAGVRFTNEPLSLSVGEEGVVSVNAVIEDDSDYTVTFTSSDEGAAVVDEMGYVTVVGESQQPVYITVTLDYMGQQFTDKCPVYIGGADN